MNSTKNSVTLILMISSLALLIVLQVLWLRSSYEKAFIDLRRESSFLFRTAVFNFRDSLVVSSIKPIKDSSLLVSGVAGLDSTKIHFYMKDSLMSHGDPKEISQVRIFVSSANALDTSQDFLKPLMGTLRDVRTPRSFTVRVGPDTLNRDTLARNFKRTLRGSDLLHDFRILYHKHPPPMLQRTRFHDGMGQEGSRRTAPSPYSDILTTESVNINPIHSYTAVFPGIRSTVLQMIAPQFLFSIFLTGIIVTSFILMYRTLRSQERLMKIKNDFISNVTHELKTPVATVSVALEALKNFNALENPERAKEYLSIAQGELNRLTLMTDKILKASVFESQGITFIPEKVDLLPIVEQVMDSMKLVFEKKNIAVKFSADGDEFGLQGSEVHLTNVIYNLLDNALKYSSDHSTVAVEIRKTENQIQLSIRDTGIGIPEEYHDKIFEKFFRVPTGDVHNVKGYGLGLNYVASVVKSHGGSITVDSNPGKGSHFKVSIPRHV